VTDAPSPDAVGPAPSEPSVRILRSYLPGLPTLGTLTAGNLSLVTLELPWRDNQAEVSCIPEGTYPCFISWSTRFKREMPRVYPVPGRSGILIHPGNVEANTEGCILVGMTSYVVDHFSALRDSQEAFAAFFDWLETGPRSVSVTITSYGGPK
jgi:hypothetical protein